MFFAPRKVLLKKQTLADFSRPRQTGVNAITIVEGDQLLEAKLTDGNCEIMMAVASGRAIRFPEAKYVLPAAVPLALQVLKWMMQMMKWLA